MEIYACSRQRMAGAQDIILVVPNLSTPQIKHQEQLRGSGSGVILEMSYWGREVELFKWTLEGLLENRRYLFTSKSSYYGWIRWPTEVPFKKIKNYVHIIWSWRLQPFLQQRTREGKTPGHCAYLQKKRRDRKVHIPQQRPAKHCGQLGTNGKRDIEGPHSSTSLKGKRPALHFLGWSHPRRDFPKVSTCLLLHKASVVLRKEECSPLPQTKFSVGEKRSEGKGAHVTRSCPAPFV